MKTSLHTALLLILTCALHAETALEREFGSLTQERDKAIAAVTDAANRKYATALEGLLRRAIQASDLATAVRITEALGRIAAVGSWAAKYSNGFSTRFDIAPGGTITTTDGFTGLGRSRIGRLSSRFPAPETRSSLIFPSSTTSWSEKTPGEG